jgi:methylglyoxal/glyoxal reductase
MVNNLQDSVTLNNGVKMPWLGLGTMERTISNESIDAIKYAIKIGYRGIDTASAYGNEADIGRAIKESGVAREELFVTTKVWNTTHSYDFTLTSFDESMKKLGLDYLDLFLIHWPGKASDEELLDTWNALEKLYRDGVVRAIGVANFHIPHLKVLIEGSEIKPMVNQVERHPLLNQKELHAFCIENNIVLQAWSPLMLGNLDNPLLVKLSKKYKKTPAQIILRWDLQHGISAIPKSVTPSRIEENANIFDFELSEEDMQKIDALNNGQRFGPNPETFVP